VRLNSNVAVQMTRPEFVAPVPLDRAYRLLNHGPTVLVTAAHGASRNVMAVAWNMALDFVPRVALVIDKGAYTRKLIEAEGTFALGIPAAQIVDETLAVGSISGLKDDGTERDKFAQFGLRTFASEKISAPLVAGCVGWLECVRIPEPHIESTYDLFLGEVVAACADSRAYADGRWNLEYPNLRTLHHVSGGFFLMPGEGIQAKSRDD
jgi:flavin reductase (DIM6/NTAB) family NADH-FMN oxidoreductase RutF